MTERSLEQIDAENVDANLQPAPEDEEYFPGEGDMPTVEKANEAAMPDENDSPFYGGK